MLFKYIIDNNEYYPENYDSFSIFSHKKISAIEFENIVKDAFELCEFHNYSEVARKIVEIDDRFFFPELVSVAYIGIERDDYDDKIRGFYHK